MLIELFCGLGGAATGAANAGGGRDLIGVISIDARVAAPLSLPPPAPWTRRASPWTQTRPKTPVPRRCNAALELAKALAPPRSRQHCEVLGPEDFAFLIRF